MALTHEQDTYFMDDPIVIRYQDETEPTPEHKHHFVEIVYMLGGKCVHTIDGVEYPVRHGDLLFINYKQTHSISKGTDKRFFNLLMKPEYIGKNLNQPENAFALLNLSEFEDFCKIVNEQQCVLSFSGRERDEIETLIFALKREYEESSPGSNLALQSGFNLLLIMIFRKMALPFEEKKQGITNEFLSYLQAHCSERITLEQAAERCFYAPSYFSRMFRQSTGMTFTQYLQLHRIEKACYLLEHTDARVSDIYMQVGYSDKTKFFRHFQQLKNLSPLQWRKKKQGTKQLRRNRSIK